MKWRNSLAVAAFNLATIATGFAGSADLKIDVSGPLSAQVGDEIHYRCVVTNQGPDTPSSIHAYVGPDNTNGGCNPINPSVSCDKYTNFDQSNPGPYFTDATNFRYFRMLLCTDASCTATSGQVSTLSSGQSGLIDIFYKAIASGTTHRFFGVVSDDSSVGDPSTTNNSVTYTLFIGQSGGTPTPTATPTPTGTPTPPPHGGLSDTRFAVNNSDTPSPGLGGTHLVFAARQSTNAGDLIVRVQVTTTPSVEGSWNDLNDGNGGRMTFVPLFGVYGLISTSYPAQDGVYFRAISSAGGYPDSISNVVGPFNLATPQPAIGSTRLDFTGNGTVADLYFRATESSIVSGLTVRIQASTNPTDERSWTTISNGTMTQSDNPKQFLLLTNNFPTTPNVSFRAIASAPGYIDSISNIIGPLNVTVVTPPAVRLTPPAGLNNSDGHDPRNPILVPYGFYSFGATVTTARSVKSLKMQVDGETRTTFSNGEKQVSITTIDLLGSFHMLEAVAVDDQNTTARVGTAPVFIKIVPNPKTSEPAMSQADGGSGMQAESLTHLYRVAVNGGVWTNASTWVDENGNNGVPTRLDSVEVGDNTIYFGPNAEAGSLRIDRGNLVGSASGPELHIYNNMQMDTCRVVGSLIIYIEPGATCNVIAASSVSFEKNTDPSFGDNFTGTFFVFGTLNIHGTGGIVGMQKMYQNGTINFLPPLSIPARAELDPAALLRPISANEITGSGKITSPLSELLTSDGAGLLTSDGAGVVSQGGGNVVSQGGGNVVSQGGGNVVSQGGGNVVSQGGGNVVAAGAGNIVSAGGGNFHSSPTNVRAASAATGFTLTGGEINLSGCTIVGSLTINGGVLSGTGFVQGDVTNNGGYIAPGHSSGTIGILGGFNQGANGMTVIEAGGANAGQFDQLQVSGTANLGGKIDVKLINGYKPDIADTFNPLTYKSTTGSFSVSGNTQAITNSTGILLKVDAAKPNPGTGQPLNISTRMKVLTGDNVLIGGFIVYDATGAKSSKKVLIRALGPSLPVSSALSDPYLILHGAPNGDVSNDNWQSGDTSQIPNGFAPGNAKESLIVATLPPGAYTAEVKGANGETGVGLVEVYDLDSSSTARLANISTRGFVDTGDNVMIGGFIVGGQDPSKPLSSEPGKILVRGVGPSLGVSGSLKATTLELHDANGGVISNQGWRSTQEGDIIATTIPPNSDNDSAILATLVPGAYTAILRGANNTTGLGLIEAYNLQ